METGAGGHYPAGRLYPARLRSRSVGPHHPGPLLPASPPPPPVRPGEEGEIQSKMGFLSPLSPVRWGGGWEREGWESEGPPRRGGTTASPPPTGRSPAARSSPAGRAPDSR